MTVIVSDDQTWETGSQSAQNNCWRRWQSWKLSWRMCKLRRIASWSRSVNKKLHPRSLRNDAANWRRLAINWKTKKKNIWSRLPNSNLIQVYVFRTHDFRTVTFYTILYAAQKAVVTCKAKEIIKALQNIWLHFTFNHVWNRNTKSLSHWNVLQLLRNLLEHGNM